MALTLDATSQTGSVGGASQTLEHTIAADANLLVVQVVSWGNNRTPSGVTWNGDAMTRVGDGVDNASGTNHAEIFYLLNPDTGTHDVVVTMPGSADGINTAATSLKGAHATPLDSTNEASTSLSDGVTTNITTVADDCWIFDGISDGAAAMTAAVGQTENLDQDGGTSMGSYKPDVGAAGGKTMSWTWSGSENFAHMVAAFKPAVAAAARRIENLLLLGVS